MDLDGKIRIINSSDIRFFYRGCNLEDNLIFISATFRGKKEDKLKIFKKILPSIFLTAIMTMIVFLFYQSYSLIGIVGITLAFWIIFNNIIITGVNGNV